MEGRSMLYAAVGLATMERGVYFSSPVIDPAGRKAIGAVVFKASLNDVDRLFQGQQETVLLISPDGVVFSTNRRAGFTGHAISWIRAH
jgi:C4-dicarboxylate-specific signal transduction histidine kinase